jgi:4-amino-4-deoxychorismate lyase
MPLTLVNGRCADSVPVTDRGLLYGDGLFETIAVRRGRPCLWSQHLARLTRGCARLNIPMPTPECLAAESADLLAAAGAPDGVLKLVVTRGSGPRGYAPPSVPTPTRILSFTAASPEPSRRAEDGVRLTLCETTLGENARLAGIKHLNRLEQVLARSEWSDPGVLEGVMCDALGHVVCGTMSNLYLLDDRGIATPPLQGCGVAGTVREVVRDCAHALGIPYREQPLRPQELFAANGLMLSNALLGLLPASRLQGHRFDPGVVPRALIDSVRQRALEPETSP